MVAAIAGSLFMGCSKSSSESSNTAASTAQTTTNTAKAQSEAPVTLKITMPGDRPADMNKIIAEAEKQMAAEGLNIKLNLVFIPFTDLKQKNQISLASGEDNDLVFDGPSWGFVNNVTAGYYEPLDDLLAQYAPEVISLRGEDMMDANKVKDQIYGIPMLATYKQGQHYNIRKDLREALGFEEITTWDELVKYAYAVKKNYPQIIPFAGGALGSQVGQSIATFPFKMDDADVEYIRMTNALPTSLMLYYKNDDGKIYNFFDDPDPIIMGKIKEARTLYQNEIIDPDVLTTTDVNNKVFEGKAAIASSGDFVPEDSKVNSLKNIDPNAAVETVVLADMTPGFIMTDMSAKNFLCLASVSKHKEAAIQFLNWTTKGDNYDLLAYGIKGVNWEPIGDKQYKVLGSSYRWFPYAWIWNPTQDRIAASATETEFKWEEFFRNSSNFKLSKLTGFTFDSSPVANEIAQDANISAKYYAAIFNGVVDPEAYLAKYKSEDYNNLKAIQNELQKQIDAFLASK
jgi:putative aldouronate transport system substrate-binding protein